MHRSKQQWHLLFQPEQPIPNPSPELRTRCIELLSLMLREVARRRSATNDWHHLIDLWAMTQTLVIDYDDTYDPTQLNDRLVLGLKGTMSLLRQRALES